MCLLETHWEQYEQLSKEMGISFVDDSPKPEVKPLLLTRYTLDNMDSAWNKLLEND